MYIYLNKILKPYCQLQMLKNILLIDDDCDDAEFFTAALSSAAENTSLLCERGGIQALQLLSSMEFLPSLILLDAGMPKMNGWECLRLLKTNSRYKQLPVIMLATSPRRKGIEEAAELGAEAYIIKPNSYSDIQNMVKIICSDSGVELRQKLLQLKSAFPASVYVFENNV